MRGKPNATVLTSGKGWVLTILAMLALRAARGSGWLRSRPCGPPLPYAARRAVLKVSGRGASRFAFAPRPPGRVEQGAGLGQEATLEADGLFGCRLLKGACVAI